MNAPEVIIVETPTETAFRLIGGPAAVGRLCGVSPQAAHKWLKSGCIPSERGRVLQVEAGTNGVVTRYQLRPDVYGESVAA